MYGRLQYRKKLFEVRNLLVVDQDIRLIHLNLHRLGVRNEIRTDVAAVELHTLYNVDGGVHTFCFADGDHAVFRNFAHCVSNQFADFGIVVGGNGSYLLDFVEVVTHYNGILLDLLNNCSNSFVNTAFEVKRVCTCRNVLQTNAHDGLCKYRCCGGTVTCLIAGFGCYFFH